MKNVLLQVMVMGLLLFHCSVQASLLDEEFSDPDFSTPTGISGHVFNFFHHSCGGNLLNDGLASGLAAAGYTLHSQIHAQYDFENTETDYRHWYKRFQRELGIEVAGTYYRYEGPDAQGDPLLGPVIVPAGFMLTWYEYFAEQMDIIMFKPCYPGSAVSAYDTVYAGGTSNNGYGAVLSGTPHADNANNNFAYLNSSSSVYDVYDTSLWSSGSWTGSDSSLAQLKVAYRGMLNIFKEHPNILFIAMQAPPMVYLSDTEAAACREFARWLREDWLHQFDPTGTDQFEDYPLPNVVPADFHNAVAWTGNDPVLDAEYFWFPVGGFADQSMDTTEAYLIGRNAGSQDHPDTWLNQRATVIMCGGADSFSPPFTGNTGRSYSCWINAVVNRWEQGLKPDAIKDVTWSGPSKTSLQWSAASNADQYFVFRGTGTDLPELLTTDPDSCLTWSGSVNSTGEDSLVLVPPVGTFLWYLVRGWNAVYGLGSPGSGSTGLRQQESSGVCTD